MEGDPGIRAHAPGYVPVARRVLRDHDVAGEKPANAPITNLDFDDARKEDQVLRIGRPGVEVVDRRRVEPMQGYGPHPFLGQVGLKVISAHVVEVGLPIVSRVHADYLHSSPLCLMFFMDLQVQAIASGLA